MSLESKNTLKLDFPVYPNTPKTEPPIRIFKKQPKPGQVIVNEQKILKYDLKRTTLLPDEEWNNFKPLTADQIHIYDDSNEEEEEEEEYETEIEYNLLLPKDFESVISSRDKFGSFNSSDNEIQIKFIRKENKHRAFNLPMIRNVVNMRKHDDQLTEEELLRELYPNTISNKKISRTLAKHSKYSSHGVVLSSSDMIYFQKYENDNGDINDKESNSMEQKLLSSKFEDTSSEASSDLDKEMNSNPFVDIPTNENQIPASFQDQLIQIHAEVQNINSNKEPSGILVDTSKINISAGAKRITLKFPINSEDNDAPIQYQTINIDISVPGPPKPQKLKFPIPE